MAGWTDYLSDWSSKDKIRLCSVYDALSALTAAVNERGSVLGSYTTLPAVNRLYPVKYYVDLIDAKIKSIVPQFVNHTLENNFIPLEYIPMWTWSDILNSEDEAILDRLYPILDWIYQRYKIVNKLRWTRTFFPNAITVIGHGIKEGETGGDWPDAWNENYTLGSIGAASNDGFSQSRERVVARLEHNIFDYDAYLFVFTRLFGTSTYSAEVFPFLGYNYQYWGRITEDSDVLSIGNIDTRPVISGSWFVHPGRVYPNPTSYPYIIKKFTGTNGFQFKDW